MSDSGLCWSLSLSITAERELFLDRSGDLLALPDDWQELEPSTEPPLLTLNLQFSES